MSLRTASALLRGKWLIEKNWADAHMPLVMEVLKGESKASALLGLDSNDDDRCDNDASQNVGGNVYSVYPGKKLSDLPDGCIAFVDIDGPMIKSGDWCSYGMDDYAELMYGLQTANNIAGVIIDIDSPGGQANGTATLSDAIIALREAKPVIGFIDDGMAASAAYWSVSACTEIYCSQSTDQVGSIGVYCTVADWYAYYKEQGLPVKDVYAPGSDDKNLDYRESIAGNDEPLKAELLVIKNAFIGAVKTNRKGKIQGTDWATGKMYFPAEAQSLGLIDGIKSFDQIVWRINRMISAINKNSNSTQTNNAMNFPKITALLGFKSEDSTSEIKLEEKGAVLEQLVADKETLQASNTALTAEIETLKGTITAKEASITTLTTDKTNLEAKILTLENGDGAAITATTEQKETASPSKEIDANAMTFQQELINKIS